MKTLTKKRRALPTWAAGFLLAIVIMVIGYTPSANSALVTIGTTSYYMSPSFSPVSGFYNSMRFQYIYNKAEINAAGQIGAGTVTKLGFNVAQTPYNGAKPNYTIRMANTTNNGANQGHVYGPFTTCKVIPSYTVSYGWDMHNFTTNFMWNGMNNICVDVCWDLTSYWSYSGRTYGYYKTGGYPYYYSVRRYYSDYSPRCNTNTMYYYYTAGPQVRMQFGPSGPIPNCSADVIAGPSPRAWVSNECQTLSASGGVGSITWEYATASGAGPYSTIAGATSPSFNLIIQSTTDWTIWVRTKRYTKPGPMGTCYSTPIRINVDCASFITYGPFAGDYIAHVKIGGTSLSNYSTYKSCGAVSDYKGTITAPVLNQGGVYPVTTDAGNYWSQSRIIHIDWNNDHQFNNTTEVAYGPTIATTTPITENVVVPCGLLTGSTVIMRVRCRWITSPSLNACAASSYTYGEIEEYYVTIGPPVPNVAAVGGNTTIDGSSNPTWYGIGNEVFAIGVSGMVGNVNHWEYNFGTGPGWSSSALAGISCQPLNLKFNFYAPQPNAVWKFRALIDGQGCNPGPSQYSSPAGITMIPAMYIASGGPCATGDYITDVKMPDAIPYTANLGNGCKYVPQSCLGGYPFYGGSYSGCAQNFADASSPQGPPTNFQICKGASYELHMRNGSYWDPQGHAAWVDWNNNNQFDVSENVFTSPPLSSSPHNVNRVHFLSVPMSTSIGGIYRMRVLTAWNIEPMTTPTNSSLGYSYGETEEYTISIAGVAPQGSIAVSSCSGTAGFCPGECAGTVLTVSANISNATFQWYYNGIPIFGATGTTIDVCKGAGMYKVKIVDPSTGCSNNVFQNVIEFTPPVINAVTADNNQVCCGEEVELAVDFDAPSENYTNGSGASAYAYFPYRTGYPAARDQIIVTKSQLLAAGMYAGFSIEALAWEVVTKNSSHALANFTIGIMHTNLTSMASQPWQSGFTTVFGPTSYTTNLGWNKHTLTTPFVWNGTQSILIEVCHGNGTYGSQDLMRYTYNYGGHRFYAYSGGNGCTNPIGATGGAAGDTRFINDHDVVITWTDQNGDTLAMGDTALITPECAPCIITNTYTVNVRDPETCCEDEGSVDVTVAPNFLFSATTACIESSSSSSSDDQCWGVEMDNYNNVASGSINSVNAKAGVKIGNHNTVAWFISGNSVTIGRCNDIDAIWYNDFMADNDSSDDGSSKQRCDNVVGSMNTPFDAACDSTPEFVYGNVLCTTMSSSKDGHSGSSDQAGPNDIFAFSGDTVNIEAGDYCRLIIKHKGKCESSESTSDDISDESSKDRTPPAVVNFVTAQPYTTTGSVTGSITGGGNNTYVYYISPVGDYHRNERINYIYMKSELDAAGFAGGGTITDLGFNIRGLPNYANQNWTLRLKHTTETTPAYHGYPLYYGDPGPWTTVHTIASYSPTSTGWDLLALNNPTFVWDGVQNLKVEVCWGPNSGYGYGGSAGSVWTIPASSTTEGFSYYYGYSTYTGGCSLPGLRYNYSPNRRAQIQMSMTHTVTVYPEPDTFTFKKIDFGSCNIINSSCMNTIYVDGSVDMGNGNVVTGLKLYALSKFEVGNNNDINGTFIADKFKVGNHNELSIACCWTEFVPPVPTTDTVFLGPPSTSQGGSYGYGPINIWYRNLRTQNIYTAAEINAAGVTGPADITALGFYIVSPPSWNLPNFRINMKHTTATYPTSHDGSPKTNVLTMSSYAPVPGGFELLAFDTPFAWDGTSNILVETCFDFVPSYTSTGITRYYDFGYGHFRYYRSDYTPACTYYYTYTSYYKTQAGIVFDYSGAKSEQPEVEETAIAVENEGINVYPNPFANSTTFSFTIAEAGKASLEIFNIAGARVATVFEGTVDANSSHNVVFNANELPTGIYFYNLTTGTKVYRGKLTIAK